MDETTPAPAASGGHSSSDTAKLKAKLASRGGSSPTRDADELKQKLKRSKLATPKSGKPEAADARSTGAGRGRTESGGRLRPVPTAPQAAGLPRRAPQGEPPTCRIALWRGYIKAQFYADVEGEEDELAVTSPAFRWWKSGPPPRDRKDVAAAHASLLATLAADGWTPVGEGDEWFALKLRRGQTGTVPDDRAGGADGKSAE